MQEQENSHLIVRRNKIRSQIQQRLVPDLKHQLSNQEYFKDRPLYDIAKKLLLQAEEMKISELDCILSKMNIVLQHQSPSLVEFHFNLFQVLLVEVLLLPTLVQLKKFTKIYSSLPSLLGRAFKMKNEKITYIVIDILYLIRPEVIPSKFKDLWKSLNEQFSVFKELSDLAMQIESRESIAIHALLVLRHLLKDYEEYIVSDKMIKFLTRLVSKERKPNNSKKIAVLMFIRDFFQNTKQEFNQDKLNLANILLSEIQYSEPEMSELVECFAFFAEKASEQDALILMPNINNFTAMAAISLNMMSTRAHNLFYLSRFYITMLHKVPSFRTQFIHDQTLRPFLFNMTQGDYDYQEAIVSVILQLILTSGRKTKVIDYVDRVLFETESSLHKEGSVSLQIIKPLLFSKSEKVKFKALMLFGILLSNQLRREPKVLNPIYIEPVMVLLVQESENTLHRNDQILKEGLSIVKNALRNSPGQFYQFLYEFNAEKLFYDVISELTQAKNWDVVREATSVEAEMLQNPGFRDIEKEKGLIEL